VTCGGTLCGEMGGNIIRVHHERKSQIRNLQEILDAMQVGIRSSPTALYISGYFLHIGIIEKQ